MVYDIFTDGSMMIKDRLIPSGGWAFIVLKEGEKNPKNYVYKAYGKLRKGPQSAGRAELEAIYKAVKYIDRFKDKTASFKIYTDCQPIFKMIVQDASRKNNRDIWDELEKLFLKNIGKIYVKYIVSHKDPRNNYADFLARSGANSLLLAPTR